MYSSTLVLPALLLGAAPYAAVSMEWRDCAAEEGIAVSQLVFSDLSSKPDPVVHGSQQVIYKKMLNRGGTLKNIKAELSQYWKAFNRTWVRFVKVTTDQCAEHPNLCPLPPASVVSLQSQHKPLAWGTPYGWYRSKQVWKDGVTGEALGCVDMQVRYCKTADTCHPHYLESDGTITCSVCREAVDVLASSGTAAACTAACSPLGIGPLCGALCSAIAGGICKDKTVDCSDRICRDTLKLCADEVPVLV